VTLPHANNVSIPLDSLLGARSAGKRGILNEETFKRLIVIERKRTERSKDPFLLMLVEDSNQQKEKRDGRVTDILASALLSSIRDTDLIGWYIEQITVGVIFTGLGTGDRNSILNVIQDRVNTTLQDKLSIEQFEQINITYHFFPDEWTYDDTRSSINPVLYPDLQNTDKGRRSLLVVKRIIDVIGSIMALTLCMPLFYVAAIAIKLSSRGPILFRQKRVGQYGRRFTLLKFRTMYANNDHNIHKRYVMNLIASKADREACNDNGEGVYKLANDDRITRVGRFLRKISFDEMPQFVNVLIGDMSLVGPRPAVVYEVRAYQTWHRRRVLDFKPGITGLWQVVGRSRVKFDDMVRLDLEYATSWSLWLDFKILIRTPLVVIKGAGAY
jgi:lipopolysaccharide/colanic/teichoic acid biosynthesis glycosyltransferase